MSEDALNLRLSAGGGNLAINKPRFLGFLEIAVKILDHIHFLLIVQVFKIFDILHDHILKLCQLLNGLFMNLVRTAGPQVIAFPDRGSAQFFTGNGVMGIHQTREVKLIGDRQKSRRVFRIHSQDIQVVSSCN